MGKVSSSSFSRYCFTKLLRLLFSIPPRFSRICIGSLLEIFFEEGLALFPFAWVTFVLWDWGAGVLGRESVTEKKKQEYNLATRKTGSLK